MATVGIKELTTTNVYVCSMLDTFFVSLPAWTACRTADTYAQSWLKMLTTICHVLPQTYNN